MAFAPIEAIKDLLTGSTWDKFKEMLEPYALVCATIFLALNLALVPPVLGDLESHPFLATLAAASDAWKLAAGTIVLLVLSYLINHLGTFSLDFAKGEIFRDSPLIGWLLKKVQEHRFQKLKDAMAPDSAAQGDFQAKRNKAAFRWAYDFPAKKEELGLTRLGNILLNPSSYVAHQYGASIQLAWPILREKLADDDKTVKAIQGNWTALQFFTSLYGLLIVVAIELIIVTALAGKNMDLWQIVALLAFAAVFYYTSLEEARQWGRGMRRIFDAHIKEIFSDLGMDGLKDLTPASKNHHSTMEAVLQWLAYGAILGEKIKPHGEWYKAEPVPAPEEWPRLKHPEFLHVQSIPRSESQGLYTKKDGRDHLRIGKTVEYLFAVTNTSTGENPLSGKEAYLLVQDAGVTPPSTVSGHLSRLRKGVNSPVFEEIPVQGRRQEGQPAGVLFPLGSVPPGSSRVLTYSYDSVLARLKVGIKIKNIELGKNKTEQYIDIFPEQLLAETVTDLEVEMLDDDHTILSLYVDLHPKQPGNPPKGKLSDDKRKGVWQHLPFPAGLEKIRIILNPGTKGA
jgi:hypothetical protein